MEKIYTTKNIDRIRVIQAYISGQCYVIISNHYYVIKNRNSILPGKVRLYKFLDGSYHIMVEGSWYEIEDIGPRSAHSNLLSEERTAFAKRNISSPWRQFNPNFTNRDRAKWDKENLRYIDYT